MASVDSSSGSSSSGRNDEVRKNREEYQANESEMVKRHQRELRRINEQHALEVENLKKEHERVLTESQKNQNKALTEKDGKYQSEIENLRTMHRKSLQERVDDQSKKEEIFKNAIDGEKNDARLQNDLRVKSLNETYKREGEEREKMYGDGLAHNKEELERGMNEQRSKLEKAHAQELEFSRRSADERYGELQHNYGTYRRETTHQNSEMQKKQVEDSQRQSDNLLRAVNKERMDRVENEKAMRDDGSDQVALARESYNRNLAKNKEDLDKAREAMENDYHGHVSAEMRHLTNENGELRDGSDRKLREQEFSRRREMANFRDAYAKNIDNYKMQRDEAVRVGNDRRNKDINDINDKNSKEMQETHRYYNQAREDQDRRLKQEYKNINSDYSARTRQLEDKTENRVRNVIETTEDERQRELKNNMDNHQMMRQQQADQIKTLRANTDLEKSDAIEKVKEQARLLEVNHQDKMATTQAKHQKDVTGLQDQLLRERKMSDDNLRRTIDDLERNHKMNMDQQMAKYEERIRVLQNQHQEEIRRVNRTNEERVNQVAATKKA